MQEPDPVVEHAELEVADTIGQLMQFWGFKRPMGRMWTLIYLSEQPCGAAELARRLRMSAGSVSMTLSELSKWGTIKKTWKPGDRRDYYEAETSIAKLIGRVFRERELRLIREVGSTLERAEQALSKLSSDDALRFKRDRIARLLQLAKVGETLVSALAAGERVDPTPLRQVAGGRR